jgi:hypothetical protein
MQLRYILIPAVAVSLSIPLVFSAIVAGASNVDLNLNVTPIQCTIDETFSLSTPFFVINPNECKKDPVPQRISTSNNSNQVQLLSRQTDIMANAPGDQSVFEGTAFEFFAYDIGIGNAKKSLLGMIMLTAALIGLALLVFLKGGALDTPRRRGLKILIVVGLAAAVGILAGLILMI